MALRVLRWSARRRHGSWGEVAMPGNKTMGVTEADAHKLVAWILLLK
ncbi:hypothetical protein [Propionivibrio sp.]|nr:hypothetical protein [Propionivibrio sp.]